MKLNIKKDPEKGKQLFLNAIPVFFVIGCLLGQFFVPMFFPLHPNHGMFAKIILTALIGGIFNMMIGMIILGIVVYIVFGVRRNPIQEVLYGDRHS